MILPAICIIYSQDAELVRRTKAYLRTMAEVRQVQDPDRIDIVLQQSSPAVLLLDLRLRGSLDLIRELSKSWPEVLMIAMGTLRSDPFREAEQAGVYAVEDLELERRSFQGLFGRAFDHLRVSQEVRDLREEATAAAFPSLVQRRHEAMAATAPTVPLVRFPRLFRQNQNMDAFLETIVQGVADATGVARTGLFSRGRDSGPYRLRAGLRYLPETGKVEFSDRDPLVRWFELHARLVNRSQLPLFEDRSERAILRRALDSFGAEVIVPLYIDGRVLGWLFFGHRQTGSPFDQGQLENLMALGEHVSTVLENAFLTEQVLLQKTLAETLLKSIPPGVVATDESGIVRTLNPSAEAMLAVRSENVIGKTIEAAAGRKLAALFRDALATHEKLERHRWIDEKTNRAVSVEIRRLGSEQNSLGAVALIQDLTAEEASQEKRDLSDHAAFWSDLAASMSHEIRNPLVAIKTYAQLLPERFDDPDFRKEFSEIVVHEIDRLDGIVSQINNFAHPRDLAFRSIDVRDPVRKALEIARPGFRRNGEINVETSLETDLPSVLGDENALAEAFAHLVANAAEAASGQDKPRIVLSAKPIRDGKHESGVLVTVSDNGTGIDPEMQEKIFSPFCTTKPRGIGLGLPIVKRTVFDHHGRVKIDSNSKGTLVSVILPSSSNGR